LPFLAPDYAHAGGVVEAAGTEFYSSGEDSAKALIVVPDIYGWNGGRTRNIADYYAKAGYLVVIPKLLTPPVNGGTDGDGWPAEGIDWSTFIPSLQTFSWEASFKPKIAACKEYLVSRGAKRIGMIGFCFGGFVVCKTLADPSLNDIFVGGASPHPSIQLEKNAYGGSVEELCAAVSQPMLLLPAGSDSEEYDAGKSWCPPKGESIRFPDQAHGWVPRGDMSDPVQAAAVQSALDHMTAFFAKLF